MSTLIYVSSVSQLIEVLSTVKGGETILLEGGDYGDLALTRKLGFDISFPSNVTIKSEDPENPAVFSTLDVRDAANLTFDNIFFDYNFIQGDSIRLDLVSVLDSGNITIRNSTFDGDFARNVSDVDNGFGYGIGLSVRGTSKITVENNEFYNFHRGMVVSESNDIVVRGNDVHSIRSDGMDFAEVTGAVIEGNYLHNFKASLDSTDHRDMIQFWTAGTDAPSTNITIRANHLDIGGGDYTQSIFMRNELVDRGLAGEEMFYRNILIEENVITNGHAHGITVGETDGLIIRNNSVLHADGREADGADPSVEIPRISVAETATNVTITNNATSVIIGLTGRSDWVVQNNAFIQDQNATASGYYEDVFLSSSLTTENSVHNFLALPDSILGTLSAGATATRDLSGTSAFSARFHVAKDDYNSSLRHFDAGFSITDLGVPPEGATFSWAFGDGTTAIGKQVSYSFASGGTYDVALTIQLPDDTTETQNLTVNIAGPEVLSYSANKGLSLYEFGEATHLDWQTSGADLGGTGTAAEISREFIVGLLGEDEFSISLTLTADSLGSIGEVMYLPFSLSLSVIEAGELLVHAYTEDGDLVLLETTGANVSDMQVHDIEVSLKERTLSISVDSNTLASTTMAAPLANEGNHDLYFGNPWGKANFDGTLTALDITVNESDFTSSDANSNVTPEDSETVSPEPEPQTPVVEEEPLPEDSGDSSSEPQSPDFIVEDDPLPEVIEEPVQDTTVTKDESPSPETPIEVPAEDTISESAPDDSSTGTEVPTSSGDTTTEVREIPENSIFGSARLDVLIGTFEGDILYGLEGNDRIFGLSSNDVLIGGSGDDRLYGGDGSDEFVFAVGGDNDRVLDFTDGTDFIRLEGIVFGDITIEEDRRGTVLTAGDDSMIIRNVGVSDITIDDFIF